MRAGPMSTFPSFMRWVERSAPQFAQSQRIARSCGSPCRHDALLRTETLTADWERLVRNWSLPAVALPVINAVSEAHHGGDGAAGPSAEFTPEAVRIINKLERSLFTEFGYRERQPGSRSRRVALS
jgi:hypothetical protein